MPKTVDEELEIYSENGNMACYDTIQKDMLNERRTFQKCEGTLQEAFSGKNYLGTKILVSM